MFSVLLALFQLKGVALWSFFMKWTEVLRLTYCTSLSLHSSSVINLTQVPKHCLIRKPKIRKKAQLGKLLNKKNTI